jgi:hypothetical protein
MKRDQEIDRKIDNELKKRDLTEKYGASFSNINDDLSPEIENIWLNNIEEFEKQYEKAKLTTVWEYIGKPEYRKITEINESEISTRLNELFDLLDKNNISLDTICEVEEKELYRFITEELFEHEMDDIRIPGMTSCFIYEEFHPNAQNEIERAIDYFFRMTMAKMKNIGGEGYDLLYIDEQNFCDIDGNAIDKEKVIKSINTFLDSFDSLSIVTYDVKSLAINKEEEDACVDFHICYRGVFDGTTQYLEIKGNGSFRLHPSEYGGWSIYQIDMPGLKISN